MLTENEALNEIARQLAIHNTLYVQALYNSKVIDYPDIRMFKETINKNKERMEAPNKKEYIPQIDLVRKLCGATNCGLKVASNVLQATDNNYDEALRVIMEESGL